jgi:hypothetical protein
MTLYMKRTVFILTLLTLLPTFMSAQQKEEPLYRHEWRFGLSGLPAIDALIHGRFHDHEPYDVDIDHAYESYGGPRRMLGLLSAEYSINRSKRFTFAVGGYVNYIWNRVNDYAGRRTGTEIGLSLHVIPTARYKYISKPAFSAYGSIGLGAMVGCEDGEFFALPTFQIIPIGITFGRKVYGFAEYGAGFTYLGGSVGIGYRF